METEVKLKVPEVYEEVGAEKLYTEHLLDGSIRRANSKHEAEVPSMK